MKKYFIAAFLAFCLLAIFMPAALSENENVARINDKEYPSIQEAVYDAEDGDTIVVIRSHEIDCSEYREKSGEGKVLIEVASTDSRKITIDFNGCTVTAKPSVKFYAIVLVDGAAQLTLKDSGSAGGLDVYAENADGWIRYLICNYTEHSRLLVESGNYSLDYSNNGDGMIYSKKDETVAISGGNFHLGNVGALSNRSPWIFNTSGKNEKNIIVTGGTFNDDILHQYFPFEVSAPKEKGLRNNGDGTWTMMDSVAYVNEQEWSGAWYTNNIGYVTLSEAVQAVRPIRSQVSSKKTYYSAPETVQLLKDCSVDSTLVIGEDTEIGLNGKNILWTGGSETPVITVKAGKTLRVEPFEPVKKGQTFRGWFTDPELQIPYTIGENGVGRSDATTDTSLYADWGANDYTITWMNGSDIHDETIQVYGQNLVLPQTIPFRNNSEFLGWYTADGKEVTEELIYEIDDDITLYSSFLAILPPTGDDAKPVLWAGMMISAMGAALLLLKRRKEY